MNILYVNKVSPRLGGGAELRLLEIGKRLVAKGHDVHVVCSKTEPNLANYEKLNGISVHYLGLLPKPVFRYKRLSFYLSRYFFYPASVCLDDMITHISPDIIVDYVSPSPSLVYLLAERLGVPCCAEVMEYLGERWFKRKDPVTALIGLISESFVRKFQYDRIIAISEFTKHELEQAGFASRDIAVVPCGVDVEKFGNTAFLERTPNSLIVVGRLVPQKGHKLLFNVLKYAREHIPDIQLCVVGDGPMRLELERYAYREGLGNNISFTGRVTEREKISLLRRSSIFVMPSLQEGFGIVLLEAMACGLPIVAFDLPVYQEFMDSDCGSLVPKMDSRAMATQIIRLLRDSETRDRIGIHNLAHVQQFGWDKMTELEERVLHDVAIG